MQTRGIMKSYCNEIALRALAPSILANLIKNRIGAMWKEDEAVKGTKVATADIA